MFSSYWHDMKRKLLDRLGVDNRAALTFGGYVLSTVVIPYIITALISIPHLHTALTIGALGFGLLSGGNWFISATRDEHGIDSKKYNRRAALFTGISVGFLIADSAAAWSLQHFQS
jgi:hypothetical protein